MAKKADEKKEKPEEKQEKKEVEKETPEDKKGETSPDDRIKSLESKIGEFGEYVGKTKEFIDGAGMVIQTIAGDPKLTKSFQEELKKRYPGMVGAGEGAGQQQEEGGEKKSADASQPDKTQADVEDMKVTQREDIVKRFEQRYGISDLKPEEQKEVRQRLAGDLAEDGWQIKTLPLQILERKLERAYIGTHAEKLREEGKLEGIAKARENMGGMMPSISGTAPNTIEEGKLTSKQTEWMDKLGIKDKEGAEKLYNEDETKRVPPAEEKK